VDALSNVLRAAQLSGGVFLHAEFTAPWCVAVSVTPQFCAPFLGPAATLIPYHYVVEGEFDAALEGEQRRKLRRGELVLFPRNGSHLLGSDLALPPVRASDVMAPALGGLYSIRHGGGGAATTVICGFLGCDSAQADIVVAALPAMMTLSVDEAGSAEWIRSTFEYAAHEVASGGPGSATVLAKLSELLFVEAIRRHIETLPAEQTGWLAGLRDPQVARALALMHGDVARPWTVEELGREAGMSRSALAERFSRLIGMAPMHYLARWRLQTAAQQLKGSSASLAQVANQAGYDSEAAFSRAFKKSFGSSPAAWRRAVG